MANKNTPAKKITGSATASAQLFNEIKEVSISRVKQDVITWNAALTMARKADKPKRHLLYNLYDEISIDGLLKSQVGNRFLKSLATSFTISDKDGKLNEEATNLLQDKIWVNEINKAILGSITHGHSLIEFDWLDELKTELKVDLFKRQNIEPRDGLFYPDYREDKFVAYREIKEFGTWILEFGSKDDLGLLNSAVPHVLFKRFAQSCWSELCEIAGIPPRVLKTDTQNLGMLRRAERMMKTMGAAAWMIIDENEKFEWAEASKADGIVYQNLMASCNGELSLLISGAVMGQDTKNGSRSKETAMKDTLQTLVDADLSLIEQYWNSKVIPALINIGVLSGELVFSYPETKDIDQLWKMAFGAMQYYNFDEEWLNSTFSLKVTGVKQQAATNGGSTLSLGEGFFV